MAHVGLATLLAFLEVFHTTLTQPSFENMRVVFIGWVLTPGRHAVTEALVRTGVSGRRHHAAFHRFFSRAKWNPEEMGRLLFLAALWLVGPKEPIRIAADDTLAKKRGTEVFGIGTHLDAVSSTKLFRIFAFGHCWVALCVVVGVPFSRRPWALPVLFRLYRTKKDCASKRHAYRKKTTLAREMLAIVVSWVGERRIEVMADSAYCNSTVSRDVPENVVFIGAMRPDAVLTARPAKRTKGRGGRPRKRGHTLAKPQDRARDSRHPWQKTKANLYGNHQTVEYKTYCAQWYRAYATRFLRVVIVRVNTGNIGLRVFFSTDSEMSVVQILETYADRWSIEVCFRDLKQLLGFADSSARTQKAVERTAPFVGLIYTTLVLWFSEHVYQTPLAEPPVRPWYRHKRGSSFADILRAAQRVLCRVDVLDPLRSLDNLRKTPHATSLPWEDALREAA